LGNQLRSFPKPLLAMHGDFSKKIEKRKEWDRVDGLH